MKRSGIPHPRSAAAVISRSAIAAWAIAVLVASCGSDATDAERISVDRVEAASPGTGTAAGDETAVTIDPALIGSRTGESILFPGIGNGGYDISVYDLDLTLSDDLTSLSGTATITASATQDLQRFSLDAQDLGVESVTVDGSPAGFEVEGAKLVIIAGEPVPMGTDFVIGVDYDAEPDRYQTTGVSFTAGWIAEPGEQLTVPPFGGSNATWAPANLDVGEPLYRSIMRIDAPEEFTVAASGIPTKEVDGEVVWDSEIPVFWSTFVVAKTETDVLDWTVPVEVSIVPGAAPRDRTERDLLEALTFAESLFGPFPYERLGVSVVDADSADGGWMISVPTQIVVPAGGSIGDYLATAAGQWAGYSEDEGADWLYQGLGEYVQSLWAESVNDDLDVNTTGRQLAGRVPAETRPLRAATSIDEIFDDVTFERGALFYHALRIQIDDDAFFTTLREFAQRNLSSFANVEDLQAVAERVSGQDLDEFFTSWLDDTVVPEVPARLGPAL